MGGGEGEGFNFDETLLTQHEISVFTKWCDEELPSLSPAGSTVVVVRPSVPAGRDADSDWGRR